MPSLVDSVHKPPERQRTIMPTVTSSNTNLPTLMIGERFGEWLRDGGL